MSKQQIIETVLSSNCKALKLDYKPLSRKPNSTHTHPSRWSSAPCDPAKCCCNPPSYDCEYSYSTAIHRRGICNSVRWESINATIDQLTAVKIRINRNI